MKILFQQGRTTVGLYQHRHKSHCVVAKKTNLAGASHDTRKLALQEAQLLSRLKHPNVVKCLEHQEEGDSVTIVMEWADLGDLSQAIKSGSTMDVDGIMTVLIQLLLGLRYLHGMGLIHRDVKTKNILASRLIQGSNLLRVKLADFGIARLTTRSNGLAQTVIGTPYYSSPEIFSGDLYDCKSDIWSLGCVIYELASGSRPFVSSDFRDLSLKVRQCTYAPLSKELPFGLRDLVDSMLQPDPKNRPIPTQLLQHPFVKDHCDRLYALLRAGHHSPSDLCSSSDFMEKFGGLKAKLGTRGAAETFVSLMAPDLAPSLNLALGDNDYVRIAMKAWARRPSPSTETDDLTLTMQEIRKL